MFMGDLDLVGPNGVAEMLEVFPQQVSRWRREGKMPEPVDVVSRVPVWERATIIAWAEETGRMP
jgi:hypothetical protein